MHAVLITFRSEASLDDLAGPFTEYAEAMRSVGGLVAKTWIADGDVAGGFHTFTSRKAADAYLGSEMVAGLTANPAFSGFEIRHFDVLDDLSRLTGSPMRELTGAAS
jgi:hypothetical protein